MKITKLLLATAFVATTVVAAHADDVDPGHPRINQVDTRIDNQQSRVQSEEATGKINANQAARDDAKLNREQNSVNKDAAKNGGHITKGEQNRLNGREDAGNRQDRHEVKKDAAAQ